MEDMRKKNLSISYEGPALETGTMDVSVLAPALLALGELFRTANEEIYGDRTKVKVNVVATKAGSFEVDLSLIQGMGEQIKDFFFGDDVDIVIKLAALIGIPGAVCGSTITLIQLYKWIKGRFVDKIEDKGDKTLLTIDEDNIEIDTILWMLYKNPNIRQALHTLITKPLDEEGINGFKIADEIAEEKVEKDEADYFRFKDLDNTIIKDEIYQKYLTIVSLTFKQNNKWRFDDGNTTYSVSIDDESFIEEVLEGKYRFAVKDVLHCKVRFKQFVQNGSLKSEYSIVKVLEHISNQMTPLIPE
ncbi:MAG: hypothetical protein OXC82_10590 [Rhodobacteraceae bacterium]|nr:hypothetical protein [Paracoccaceae bacterium]MCY4250863.1 hypothetical protein [Paracoccaceae bacterium]